MSDLTPDALAEELGERELSCQCCVAVDMTGLQMLKDALADEVAAREEAESWKDIWRYRAEKAEGDAQAYKAMYEREKARANRAVDRLYRVRALAGEYQASANSEGYGGGLWSTTAADIYRALGDVDE